MKDYLKLKCFVLTVVVHVLQVTTVFASDYFVVVGGRMEASCGTLQLALESVPSGLRVSRLKAGNGIGGRQPMPLFELMLSNSAGEQKKITSYEGWEKIDIRKSGSTGCLLKFARTMTSGELSLTVKVQLVREESDTHLSFSWEDCKIPSGWTLERTVLLPLRFAVLPQGTKFFYPYCSGILCDPVTESIERSISYPSGFGASMSWYALYDDGGGIYYAAHDPEATVKNLYMKTTPGTGMEMWFDYPATAKMNYNFVPAEANIILAPLDGDWYDGAMKYRCWVREEANWYPRDKMGSQGRTDTPKWMKELSLWVQGEPSLVKQFQEVMRVPMGFHWYNWHVIPFDNDYPHYFPAREGFREAVDELQTSDIYVMPYINGRLWDTRDNGIKDSLFTSLARPAVVKQKNGKIITERYGSKESDGSDVELGVMCPETNVWQNKMKEVVLGLCGSVGQEGNGTKGVYMDQIAAAPPVNCYDSSHGHPLGGGSWWTSAYREMLENIRSEKPADAILTTESNADGYIDVFDGFLVWQFQHNNQVPAFGAVYGGAIQLFGRTYASTNPIDFKMTLAQSFVWGEQLGWFQANSFLTSADFIFNVYPFLRQVVNLRYKFSPYFYKGEMTRAPRLTGNNPIQVGNWMFTGTMKQVENPSVMCGAWNIPSEQRTLLLFANYSKENVRLTLDYFLKEWGFEEGQYEAARYDGNGAKQSLDKLPSEIVFNSDEAFVIELTPLNTSVLKKVQNEAERNKVYYDLNGRYVGKNHKGIRIERGKKLY